MKKLRCPVCKTLQDKTLTRRNGEVFACFVRHKLGKGINKHTGLPHSVCQASGKTPDELRELFKEMDAVK